MNYKYLILDFGNVLATHAGRSWMMTPKFEELIDMDLFDMESYNVQSLVLKDFLSEHMTTLEEEYDMFLRFYDNMLKNTNYPKYDKKLVEEIAYDRTYNYSKYKLFDNVIEELERLKKKYKLILLSDNWPCAIPYMKENKILDYFDKIYLSCEYDCLKKDRVFFDYPIKDYNIKPGEALFIDDDEINLDAAHEKGLDVMLMDRFKEKKESKYKIINDLMGV